MNSKTPESGLRGTVVAACVLGALFALKGMATGMLLVGIVMAFWVPYSLFVITRKPERRKARSAKLGIWLLMAGIVLAIHFVRHVQVRGDADAAVQAVRQFRETHGRYPERLEEAGLRPDELRGRIGSFHYSNKPHFYYDNTLAAFHLWSYDFGQHEWVDLYD